MDSIIQVRARTTAICCARIADNRHYVTDTVMEVFATHLPRQLQTTPSLSKITKQTLAVQIYNNTDTEQILHKGTIVGVARPISCN